MSARRKLNWNYFNGSLLLAAAAGLVAQSWAVFVLGLLALFVLNLCAGEIRPPRRGR